MSAGVSAAVVFTKSRRLIDIDPLFGESRRGDSFLHQANVVHHPNAAIQDLEHLVDLHPAAAVAVVENGIADDDPAFRIDLTPIHLLSPSAMALVFSRMFALVASGMEVLSATLPVINCPLLSTLVTPQRLLRQ